MAINRDPAEWFEHPANDIAYGIVRNKEEWLVLRKERLDDWKNHISEVARVPTRDGAIGIIKLLRE